MLWNLVNLQITDVPQESKIVYFLTDQVFGSEPVVHSFQIWTISTFVFIFLYLSLCFLLFPPWSYLILICYNSKANFNVFLVRRFLFKRVKRPRLGKHMYLAKENIIPFSSRPKDIFPRNWVNLFRGAVWRIYAICVLRRQSSNPNPGGPFKIEITVLV